MNWNPMMGPLGASASQSPDLGALVKAFAGPQNSLGQSGVTLGNPEAQDQYRQMAEAFVMQQRAAQDQEAANALQNSGWINNSGALGVLDQVFKAYASKKLAKRADEKDIEASELYYKGEEAAAAAKEAREQKKAEAATQRKLEIIRRGDQAEMLANGIELPKQEQYKPDWRERTLADGSTEFFDINGGPPEPQRNSPAADAGFSALRDAVEWQESRGNPDAVSPVGARGRMQTMPNTLRDPGYGITPARDNSDEEMTRVGNEYLQAMVGKYGTEGGLAAYNWGPGNWERALESSGGDPRAALALAPKETRDYVPSVLGRVGSGGGVGMGWGVGSQQAGPRTIKGDAPKAKEEKYQSRQYSPEEVAAIGLPAGTVAYTTESGKPEVVNKPTDRVAQLSAGEAATVRKQHKDLNETLAAFKAFDQAMGDTGNLAIAQLNGEQKGRLGTAYNNARAQLRILYNTGVLQPGELPMLEQALKNPNGLSSLDPRTRGQIQSQLDELYRTTERSFDNLVSSYPQLYDSKRYEQTKAYYKGPQKPAASGPKAGTVEGGYRFKGGDAGNQSNWEKL